MLGLVDHLCATILRCYDDLTAYNDRIADILVLRDTLPLRIRP